jgi:hypothetical protein
MKTAPYYQFTKPRDSYGCAAHNDVECLCDVVIGTPVPIMTEAPHAWFQAALDVLDHDMVDARNLHEVISVTFGLWTLNDLMFGPGRDEHRPAGPQLWRDLPEDVRLSLRYHYRVGTPWEIAVVELEETILTETEMAALRKYYVERMRTSAYERNSTKAAERQHRRHLQSSACGVDTCQYCGAKFEPFRNKVVCSSPCRQALYRLRSQEARRG